MRFAVYYARELASDPPVSLDDLARTHAHVADVEADDLDGVFLAMQAESWSPQGEARPIIARAGVDHTSMSVGDVIRDEQGTWWAVDFVGFQPIPPEVIGE